MKSLLQILKEIYYADYYSKAFNEFRKKYLPISKTPEGAWLYVQFTSFQESVLHKNPNPNPDHSDPIGIYGYPLKYVIQNPGDIWYGQRAKYLRILKHKMDNSRTVLSLQGLNSNQIDSILSRMFPHEDIDYLMKLANKVNMHRDWRNINKLEKNMMTVIQLDLTQEQKKDDYNNKKYPVRSGIEQTNLFLKAGYDTILDAAKNEKQAIMNEREPQQIIFLKRNVFDVIDIFQLQYDNSKDGKWVGTTADYKKTIIKLAAIVAEAIGDKLLNDKIMYSDSGFFWTKKGRRIEVEIGWSESRFKHMQATQKMGQKKHKEGGLSSVKRPEITVYGEFGKENYEFGESTKFKEIADEFKKLSDGWMNTDKNWEPENKEIYLKKQEEKKHKEIEKRVEEHKQEQLADYEKNYRNELIEFSKLTGLPWTPPKIEMDKWKVMGDIDLIEKTVSRNLQFPEKDAYKIAKETVNGLDNKYDEDETYSSYNSNNKKEIMNIFLKAYEIESEHSFWNCRSSPLQFALRRLKGEEMKDD